MRFYRVRGYANITINEELYHPYIEDDETFIDKQKAKEYFDAVLNSYKELNPVFYEIALYEAIVCDGMITKLPKDAGYIEYEEYVRKDN